jgi:serine/threonine protein kinase
MLRPHRRAEVGFNYTREIGQHGQNSRTFIAQDHQLNADIVIKEMEKADLDSGRFFAEAQALYASAHPNVVQIHYACEDDDSVYVAMPLYQNGSLKDLLARQFMTVREIIIIGCQVLAGLQHVHSKRLVHFDVKPDNVLLSDRGEGLLSDFGLARPIGPHGLANYDFGYVRTQPPEGFAGYEFPRTFDIYQVGMLLYRMCCGNDEFERQFIPFMPGGVFERDAFRVAVVNAQFPNRRIFPAHIPEALRAVVRKCLEVDPNDRYSSALEVANSLATIDGATLDWRYSKRAGCQRWVKTLEEIYYEFEFADSGGTTCFKTKGAGQRRRVGDGCADRMTDRQVRSFLGDH